MTRKTFLLAAMIAAACSAGEAPPVDAASADDPWDVSARGIGKLSAGMTLEHANAALGGTLVIPATMQECDWVRAENAPAGLTMMVENGRISRVDVIDSSIVRTTAGAKIGDTEERIMSLYPGQVDIQPHKYTHGRYLIVTPSDPADSVFRIVFETDGQRVIRYRSGLLPAVQYVEGCS